MLGKGPRGGQRVRTPGANRANAVIGLDYIAIAGYQKRGFRVCDNQQRFQVPQRAVLPSFLGQFDGGFCQVALMFLEFAFKTLEERQRVRRRTRKARQNFIAEQTPRFPGRMFHHVFPHRDLAVGGDHHFIVAAHAKNRRAMYRG